LEVEEFFFYYHPFHKAVVVSVFSIAVNSSSSVVVLAEGDSVSSWRLLASWSVTVKAFFVGVVVDFVVRHHHHGGDFFCFFNFFSGCAVTQGPNPQRDE
jgi:hypothetical protein